MYWVGVAQAGRIWRPAIELRITGVTLGAEDLERAAAFYRQNNRGGILWSHELDAWVRVKEILRRRG